MSKKHNTRSSTRNNAKGKGKTGSNVDLNLNNGGNVSASNGTGVLENIDLARNDNSNNPDEYKGDGNITDHANGISNTVDDSADGIEPLKQDIATGVQTTNVNDSINSTLNIDTLAKQINEVMATNLVNTNNNSALLQALVNVMSNINNGIINKKDTNKNKFKIQAVFGGNESESVTKFINLVKLHQQRFGLSDMDVCDILYTSETNLIGKARTIVHGEILNQGSNMDLQTLFDLLRKSFGKSRVHYLKQQLYKTKLKDYKSIHEYVANVHTVLSDLNMEIRNENERLGYEIFRPLDARDQAKQILKGLPAKLKEKTLDKLGNKALNFSNIQMVLQQLGSLQDQLFSLSTNQKERHEINALFDINSNNNNDYNKHLRNNNYTPGVCRYGVVSKCPYGSNCKYSHVNDGSYGGSGYNAANKKGGGFRGGFKGGFRGRYNKGRGGAGRGYNNYYDNNKKNSSYSIRGGYRGGRNNRGRGRVNGRGRGYNNNNEYGYQANRYNRNNIKNVGICFSFKNTGTCRFGNSCRFKHINNDTNKDTINSLIDKDIASNPVNDKDIESDNNTNNIDLAESWRCPQQ